MGAAAARGEVGTGRLVDERLVEGLAEDLLRQVGLGLLAEDRSLDSGGELRRRFFSWVAASAIASHLDGRVLAPGTEPGSGAGALRIDLDDVRAALGDRRAPICPGIFIPLKTRAGSALAPMEPGRGRCGSRGSRDRG